MAQNQAQSSELGSIRDTVESVAIAIILAFVLRAFIIEAFVIPTGSMAPRLMGKHWQFDCPACAYHYPYGIPSTQSVPDVPLSAPLPSYGLWWPRSRNEPPPPEQPTVCPNCGLVNDFEPRWGFGGDRVLVLKYLYRFRQPEPWDVVVFKNPQDNIENFIKRLIGLPGQRIEIIHGDIFVADGADRNNDGLIDEQDFAAQALTPHILRKSHRTQQAMWYDVFDADYQPDAELFGKKSDRPWFSPWQVQAGDWSSADQGRAMDFAGGQGRLAFGMEFLRAEHELWNKARQGLSAEPPNLDPLAQLEPALAAAKGRLNRSQVINREEIAARLAAVLAAIQNDVLPRVAAADGRVTLRPGQGPGPLRDAVARADREFQRMIESDRRTAFLASYAYNQAELGRRQLDRRLEIDSDLRLEAQWVPQAADSAVTLELSSLRDSFRGRFAADGSVKLLHGRRGDDGQVKWDDQPWASPRRPARALGRTRELALSHVDHRVTVWLDGEPVAESTDQQYPADAAQILAEVQSLADDRDGLPAPTVAIAAEGGKSRLQHLKLMRDVFYTNPTQGPGYGTTGHPIYLVKNLRNPDMDSFFVLGDNSPASKDSRLWDVRADSLRKGYQDGTVPRYNMIGKAFFVYWPGGYRLPPMPRLAIIPNVGRMRFIR